MSPDQPTTRRRRTSRGPTGALALAAATALTAALLPGLAQSATAGTTTAATTTATTTAGLPTAPTLSAEDRLAPASTVGEQLLTAVLTTPTEPVDRGEAFTVSGTVSTVAEGLVGRALAGVPADFTLQVTDPEGRVLAERALTAGPDGRFTTTVPGSVTADAPGTDALALAVRVVDARHAGFAAADAGAAPVAVRAATRTLQLRNSFVSAVGWVKPGQTYPSRIVLTNPTGRALSGARVVVTAPRGTTFRTARGAGARSVTAKRITWRPGTVRPGRTTTLVVTSRAQTLRQQPTLVWRDLSTRATLTQGKVRRTTRSHGPKVIPPNATYETARYGDRPFPVVPVQYVDRSFSAAHSGGDLDRVINARSLPGSTFNLFQEMSLGQLFPDGTVPSAGIATAGFDYAPGFPLTTTDPATTNTCTGVTFADSPVPAQGTPLYPERITDGVYNLPGTTQYYGADANGSAVIGSLAGVAALQQIDSGCGPTGKIVADAAALADPEVDYSDFDTDKDGVVDFFMAVFAGCGGNGASQLAACTSEPSDAAPYDNIWPHSSSLEFYLTDPVTGLPGFATDDQLEDLQGRPLYWADASYSRMTTKKTARKVFVRVGPYNLNPETAIDKASVISHEYGHSLGLPDFYSLGGRETYGDWNLMATDKSQHMDAYSRQELGWVVPRVLPKRRTLTVDRFTDSKQDVGTITWRTPGGKPYTLRRGRDGIVQNSLMYVARLRGRQLLDPATFATGDGATRSHAWFSGSGNDFGCATDGGGRNLDIALPGARTLPAGSTISVAMKSMWDIEWDYDYGYVLTSRDGRDFASHGSENGYTTSNTDPLAGNPNQNGCQAAYDNGLTGTSGSYQAGTQAADRKLGETPEAIFLADSYDVSELVGAKTPILRFSYATDPGLARPGWFIDDVVVTATLPNGSKRTLFRSDFERSGSPDDPQVFNGGCKADGPGTCTLGWNYVQAGQAADFDHAYYLEMRDRSGFDLDGKGQIDRDPIAFQPGLSLVYTDEAHGYGNAGTDDPPAQSPLDATPTPGSATPDLSDAAWTTAKGRNAFSDSGSGHVDNYTDPSRQGRDGSGDTAWRFDFGCLAFRVLSMSGQGVGPKRADGDLTGRVRFTTGRGCGPFDYGYRR